MAQPTDNQEPEGGAAPHRPSRLDRIVAHARAHPRRWAAAGLLLLLLAILAILGWRYLQSYESTDDAQVDGHISPVSTRVAGTVLTVRVEDNQYVQAGDLLVELDPRDYEVSLARAEAEAAEAEARVAAANPQVPITSTSNLTRVATAGEDVSDADAALEAARRNYDSARAQVAEAEANEAKARSDIDRYRYLAARDAVTAESLDEKIAAARVAAATVTARRAAARAAAESIEQQRARLSQARSRHGEAVGNAPRQLSIQRAAVTSSQLTAQAARAARDQARLNLGYARIVAPVSGVVGRRTVEVGARVQPGQSLLSIVDVDHLWVTANFKETQLRRMRPGDRGRFSVDAFDRDYDCEVESLPGASGARFSLFPPENATGNYVKVVQRLPVRLRISARPDDMRALRPGMSVEPKIWLRSGR